MAEGRGEGEAHGVASLPQSRTWRTQSGQSRGPGGPREGSGAPERFRSPTPADACDFSATAVRWGEYATSESSPYSYSLQCVTWSESQISDCKQREFNVTVCECD